MKSKKVRQVFTVELQYEVVQRVLSGELNKRDAMKEYGIKGSSCILYWKRKFEGQDNYRKGEEKLPFTLMDDEQNQREMQRLEKRVKELEADLRTERLRAGLWEKVVEIAERDLGVDITKKYGARQSVNMHSNTKEPQ